MGENDRVIAVIPARGGSKSVPGKNIKPLGGKPLIAWSIEVARQVPEIDRVIVSTDDVGIANIAREWGAEVYERPAHLATDHALVIDALRDLASCLRQEDEAAQVIVLLEPTCPFRAASDVAACVRKVMVDGLDSVATFKPASVNPHRTWRMVDDRPQPFIEGVDPWQPRQKLPQAYQLNGAVYVFRVHGLDHGANGLLFGRTGAILMPEERSVDIDNALDFAMAEMLIRERA